MRSTNSGPVQTGMLTSTTAASTASPARLPPPALAAAGKRR
jgi:hypothetical protein